MIKAFLFSLKSWMMWKKKRLACQTNSYLVYEQAPPGHPGLPGWGREEGKESFLSPSLFFTARAPRRADRFCCPQANSNPNYGACIKSCFSGFNNRVLQKRQILNLLRASPDPPFYTERISSVLPAVLCLAWFICRAARQALLLQKFPAGIPASRNWDLSLLRRCV